MKLLATIAPRRDGTVIAIGASGAKYTFATEAPGTAELVAEVEVEDLPGLLCTGNFAPLDDADFEAAAGMVGIPPGSLPGQGDHDGDDDDGDDDADPNALPIEAGTPPQPGRRARDGKIARRARS